MVKYTEKSSVHLLYSGILHLIHEQMGHINEQTAVSNECFSLSIAIYYMSPATSLDLLKTAKKFQNNNNFNLSLENDTRELTI